MRWPLTLVLIPIICIALITLYTDDIVNSLLFHPVKGLSVKLEKFKNIDIENIFIKTSDGIKINAFYLPAKIPTKRTILFFHGNAGNASQRLNDAISLMSLNANVFLMEYRGFGLSDGVATEDGIYKDAGAALNFLIKDKKTPIEKIILYGRSLGSVVAIELAQNRAFSGVILISPLSSGIDMAKVKGLYWLRSFVDNPLDSIGRIKNMQSPLLIIHGTKDEVIPIEQGFRLMREASVLKEMLILKNASHNDITEKYPKLFFERINSFLNKVQPVFR
ncbi:MAG: prolyl oligopeptidase family serine peptidase [Methylococcales bacterium]|jgi:uncharacterized protein|nr:prolyl oligopeptidase family serine peptidase [Methylococcales bacterium]